MTDLPSRVVPKPTPQSVPLHPLLDRIACPLRACTNPHEARAADSANAWYRRIWGETPFTRGVISANMERLVSGFYPDADEQGLELVNRYLLWAFSVDDMADESDSGRNVKGLAQLFSRFEDIFRGRLSPTDGPLERGLVELARDFRLRLSPTEYDGFVSTNLAYFGAMLWEANNRQCRWVPDEATYLLLRPAAGAVPPFWHLIEALTGARAGVERHQREQCVALARLAGRLVCWHNDLLSHEKERANGDVHNLCVVLERHRACSWDEAISSAVALANADMVSFVELASTIEATASSMEVLRYVSTLESMVATTLLWTSESVRYRGLSTAPAVESRTG